MERKEDIWRNVWILPQSAIEAVVLLQICSRRTIVLKCEFKVLLPNIARYMPILEELFVNKFLLRIWYDKKV